ncbi:MAG: hypothetical protein C0505_18920 [Leptothrix sp. (in: Bacteria)]|nr:hypothetical protein [Leptothrix sp. (in: b-proteobacteria)]
MAPSGRPSSVTSALFVLKAFSAEEAEIGLSSLARRLGLSRSTMHRLAATLAVLSRESVMYLHKLESGRAIGLCAHIGGLEPDCCTALHRGARARHRGQGGGPRRHGRADAAPEQARSAQHGTRGRGHRRRRLGAAGLPATMSEPAHRIRVVGAALEFGCAANDTVLRAAQRSGIGFTSERNVGSCGDGGFKFVEGEVASAWPEAPPPPRPPVIDGTTLWGFDCIDLGRIRVPSMADGAGDHQVAGVQRRPARPRQVGPRRRPARRAR